MAIQVDQETGAGLCTQTDTIIGADLRKYSDISLYPYGCWRFGDGFCSALLGRCPNLQNAEEVQEEKAE